MQIFLFWEFDVFLDSIICYVRFATLINFFSKWILHTGQREFV